MTLLSFYLLIVQPHRRVEWPMLDYYADDVVVALVWDAQHVLQSQRHHQQLYGSLLAAAAAASQHALLVQQQETPTIASNVSAALPDERPAKKTATIWSPATDIENNNNNRTSYSDSSDAAKWKLNNDRTKMSLYVSV